MHRAIRRAAPRLKRKKRNFKDADCNQLFRSVTDNVERRDVSDIHDLTELEAASIPAVLTGISAGWPAETRWSPEALLADERFIEARFDVDGKRMTLVEYNRHCALATVRRLPCIFEDLSDEMPHTRALLEDFDVPEIFCDDLFETEALWDCAAQRMRYRWFLFGAQGSGSPMHSDPLGTSAWNALLSGTKLWACFPPCTEVCSVGVTSCHCCV